MTRGTKVRIEEILGRGSGCATVVAMVVVDLRYGFPRLQFWASRRRTRCGTL